MRSLRWTTALLAAAVLAFGGFWIANVPDRDLRGTWGTLGYGLGFDIGRFRIKVYEVTPGSCIEAFTIPANLWLLDRAAGYRFTSPEPDRLTIYVDEVVGPIEAEPATFSDRCGEAPDLTAAGQWDLFWTTFNQHYPFFEQNGVDWSDRRALGQDVEDEASLAAAMGAAVAEIDDHNVALILGSESYFGGSDPDWTDRAQEFADVTEAQLSSVGTVDEAEITYGRLPDDIGVIRLDGMDPGRGWGSGYDTRARHILSDLLVSFGPLEGLVLDLRWNTGGSNRAATGYASLFGETPRTVGTKAVQQGPELMGEPIPVEIDETPLPGFDGPVVILTSGATRGAAEVFLLAMRDLPQVTVLGEPTAGSLSDSMSRHMPNDWQFVLSHQVYRDSAGEAFDGRGVPPHEQLGLDVEAFDQGRDTALEAAVDLLK
ncbi:S41 family peptidase [Histidinibacterium aquaticum]|uniref:S41 family peptidase n=1 Tax=Histidinibacterium aquaticum TaxID=2613962 RepID=A0A5J5GMW8_9RHOB|nr:S41 family peptidase [Histidinibacterium aquaticum]KAA9008958.1 S41 family peptidase [Histidinibacterium aquaticum]